MTSVINVLMGVFMIVGIFKGNLSIITSIIFLIISNICFYKSLKRLGDSKNPIQRQKSMNILVIDGISISVICIIAFLNIAIYNLKLLIIFLVLSLIVGFIGKFFKKRNK